MADNRVFGKIEYGFREALQKLSDSMTDASAIVGSWKEICTSDQPTVTLSMSDGDHEVMTLTGIKESLSDWVNQTTGTLVRSVFRAENAGRLGILRPARLVLASSKPNHLGGRSVPSYRTLGAFADVLDVYRLSHVSDTDRFTSLFELPRIFQINLNVAATVVGETQVHKIAIRSTPDIGNFPDGRATSPIAPLATEFFIHNELQNPITIEFYSGTDYSQKVAAVQVPGHTKGHLSTAVHLVCMGTIGAPVSIARVI